MVEIHRDIREQYNDMVADYAMGDHREINEKVILFSMDNGKSLKGMKGLDYFMWIRLDIDPDAASHKVFGIDDYEKYKDHFEKKGNKKFSSPGKVVYDD